MSQILHLDGHGWVCKPYLGMDWQRRKAHEPENGDPNGWIPATVPGSVQHDLWQARQIPNPYFERNSLLIEWVPQRTWVYRKCFTVDESARGQRARLTFEGIDYEAEIFLNGISLGHHRGMFTPAQFNVEDELRYGAENVLAVVIEPAPPEQPQIGRTSLVRTHKTRMNYWWDFCPRIVHLGIWDQVTLEFTGPVRIEDLWVRPQLDEALSHASVTVQTVLDATHATDISLEVIVRHEGQVVAVTQVKQYVTRGRTTIVSTLDLPEPELWWPNGMGDQPLYEAEAVVWDTTAMPGAASATRRVRFGIRQIKFVPNDTPDATARSYTLVVNGRKAFIKGWNWVPMNVLYGVEQPGKLAHLLTLAQRAHVNLLRVWGGGLIERESFYDLCDRLGLLVWQEFIQSSSGIDNRPPEDEAYIATIVGEAEVIIPRRRNHPSLALWCGGNELMDDAYRPLDERHPVLGALHEVVARLDPDRHWLPTSASGPEFSNGWETIRRNPQGMHDVHGPWEHQGLVGQFALYNAGQSLLHSEFGVEGITNQRTLDRVIAPEHQWPISLDNPVWMHLGAWWVKATTWEAAFGPLHDVKTTVRVAQFMQADGLRYAVEADRRRKWHNSGTLPWQFNEPYPMAACTSAVNYFGHPKPAYYAVARAYEALHVSARFDRQIWPEAQQFTADLWVSNSCLHKHLGRLTWRVVDLTGKIIAIDTVPLSAAANAATQVGTAVADLSALSDPLFFLDLGLVGEHGAELSRNRYVFSKTETLAPLLTIPPTSVDIASDRNDEVWTVRLRNTGPTIAFGLWLEEDQPSTTSGYALFSDNALWLLPGEVATIQVKWQNVASSERRLTLSGWNINTRSVPGKMVTVQDLGDGVE